MIYIINMHVGTKNFFKFHKILEKIFDIYAVLGFILRNGPTDLIIEKFDHWPKTNFFPTENRPNDHNNTCLPIEIVFLPH